MRYGFQILLMGSLLLIVGCPPPLGPVPEPITRQDALKTYNANVSAIESFRAGIFQWEAKWIDPDGKEQHFKELGGKIFYQPAAGEYSRPKIFAQTEVLSQDAWVVGSNETEYWMYSEWGKFGRWGKHKHYGKHCAAMLPIHPQVLLEFIGLLPLPIEPPYPLYKVHEETYSIEYIVLKNEGYLSKREIIIDRRTDLPREINAYNADGLLILHSELRTFKSLDKAMLPTEIFISFPKENSFLRLKLKRYRVDPDPQSRAPLFVRPKLSGIEDYQQIDKDCEYD